MNKPANQPNDELRQQLWELSYGLLDDEAETTLRARIKSDPALARLYAEVRLQSDLVAAASRVEDSSLHISAGPDLKCKVSPARDRAQFHRGSALSRRPATGAWATNWLAVGGTVALLVLLTFGLMQPDTTKSAVARVDFYTSFAAPADMNQGLSTTVDIETRDIHDNGRAAELDVRLVDSEGRETFRKKVKTSTNGHAQVELPGEALGRGTRLEVHPADERAAGDRGVSAELKVAEQEQRTLFLLEKPFAEAGETVRFSMVGVNTFSKTTELPVTDELMIEDGTGTDVVQPMWTADNASGVITGEFQLPQNAPQDLAMRRRQPVADAKQRQLGDEAKKDAVATMEKYYFNAQRDRGARQQQQVSPLGRALALQQQPRGGSGDGETLRKSAAAGAAADRPAKPGEIAAAGALGGGRGRGEGGGSGNYGSTEKPAVKAMMPAAPPAPASASPTTPAGSSRVADPTGSVDKALADKAEEEKTSDGRALAGKKESQIKDAQLAEQTGGGSFGKQQAALQQAALEDAPGLAPANPTLEDKGSLAKWKKVTDGSAAKPSEVSIPDEVAKLEGVAVVTQGPRVIARQKLPAAKEAGKAKVHLPPEAEGEFTLNVYAESSATPVYRQRFLQESARQLHFDVKGLKDHYAPGEEVQLALRVLNEEGRPVVAALGVRVWSDEAVRTTNVPLSLSDALAYETNREAEEVAEKELAQQNAVTLAATLPATNGAGIGGGAAPPRGFSLEKRKQDELAASNSPARPPSQSPAPVEQRAFGAPAGPPGATPTTLDATFGVQPSEEVDRLPRVENEAMTATALNEQLLKGLQDDIVLADNRAQVQRDYQLAVAATQMHETEKWQNFGRVLIWSAAGLLLIVGLILIARQPLRTSVLIPAVGLSVICLALGVTWFIPREPAGVVIALNETAKNAAETTAAPAIAPTPIADPKGRRTNESADMLAPPAEPGEAQLANGQARSIESLKHLNAPEPFKESSGGPGSGKPGSTKPDSGQGLGGFGPPPSLPMPAERPAKPQGGIAGPAPTPSLAPAAPARPKTSEADVKSESSTNDVRTNRTGNGSVGQRREVEANAPGDKPAPGNGGTPLPRTEPADTPANLSGNARGPFGGGYSPLGVERKQAEQKQGEERRALDRAAGASLGGQAALPDSIFWRPLSPVESDGTVTINFTMPAAESEYRILIDAIGGGRMGSQQLLLICREPK